MRSQSQIPEPTDSSSHQTKIPNRQIRGKALTVLIATLCAVLVAELALRVVGFTYFNPYMVDQHLGFALRPNAEGWWTREGKAYVKINSHGMRDNERTFAKPNNTIRIAILGDSFAEALQVPFEDAFPTVIQNELNTLKGKRVEVLNFGVSGFSTARELIMLRERVWHYSPDVVILLVTTANDIKDNSSALTEYSSPLPYFVLRNGSLTLDDSRLQALTHSTSFKFQQSAAGRVLEWFKANSRVLGLLYTIRENYLGGPQRSRRVNPGTEANIDDRIFHSSVSREWEEAWVITEKLIVQMRDEVQAKGVKFLVVTGSIGIQVTPKADEQAEYMRRFGLKNLSYPDERINQLCKREHIAALNLVPPLWEFAKRNQSFVHGFGETKGTGHWNEQGHKVVGQEIAKKVEELFAGEVAY